MAVDHKTEAESVPLDDVETSEANDAAEAERAQEKRMPMDDPADWAVEYTGTSHWRAITAANWLAALGRPHPEVRWERDAPFNRVPVTRFDLDPDEFRRFIVADVDLRVVPRRNKG